MLLVQLNRTRHHQMVHGLVDCCVSVCARGVASKTETSSTSLCCRRPSRAAISRFSRAFWTAHGTPFVPIRYLPGFSLVKLRVCQTMLLGHSSLHIRTNFRISVEEAPGFLCLTVALHAGRLLSPCCSYRSPAP